MKVVDPSGSAGATSNVNDSTVGSCTHDKIGPLRSNWVVTSLKILFSIIGNQTIILMICMIKLKVMILVV